MNQFIGKFLLFFSPKLLLLLFWDMELSTEESDSFGGIFVVVVSLYALVGRIARRYAWIVLHGFWTALWKPHPPLRGRNILMNVRMNDQLNARMNDQLYGQMNDQINDQIDD